MEFIKLPTLQHLAFVKLAISLWEVEMSKNQLLEFILLSMYSPSERYDFMSLKIACKTEWCELRDGVLRQGKKLSMPDSLEKKFSRFITGIGWEIAEWFHFHTFHDLFSKIPDTIIWNQLGIINVKKTAELLVCNEALCIVDRYKLACAYCLETHISGLWSQLLEEKQESEVSKLHDHKYPLVCFWSDYNENKLDPSYMVTSYFADSSDYDNAYTCGFLLSELNGNASAAQFFFQKMTDEERDRLFLKTTCMFFELPFPPREVPVEQDILYFSLSTSNEEQQMDLFKRYPFECLTVFLDWPWQDIFMKAYQCIKPFLGKKDLYRLYEHLALKDIRSYDCYDYKNIFIMVWQQNPAYHDIDMLMGNFQEFAASVCSCIRCSEDLRVYSRIKGQHVALEKQ